MLCKFTSLLSSKLKHTLQKKTHKDTNTQTKHNYEILTKLYYTKKTKKSLVGFIYTSSCFQRNSQIWLRNFISSACEKKRNKNKNGRIYTVFEKKSSLPFSSTQTHRHFAASWLLEPVYARRFIRTISPQGFPDFHKT